MRVSDRAQAERSAETRSALERAAIDVVVERGWAETTSVAVAGRAGVTRGALRHHYDGGLPGLLVGPLRRPFADYESATTASTSLMGAVASMWSVIGDRDFKAVIESWMAAGHDVDLAARLTLAVSGFAMLVEPDARLVLRESVSSSHEELARSFLLSARATMLGLALGRTFGDDCPLLREPVVLKRLHQEASSLDEKIPNEQRKEQ